MRRLIGNIIQANKLFKIINNGDKIVVGVSGGKDSMTLLYSLYLFKQKVKKELNWDIDVMGVHCKLGFFEINYNPFIEFWKDKGIKFLVLNTNISEILKKHYKNGLPQCSLCSKIKKAILVDVAKEHGFNKIAMGHHADDAIETLFMNMIREGRIATFMPEINLDRSGIIFIRPFILAREKVIQSVSKKLNFPILYGACPRGKNTERDWVKKFLNDNFYNNERFKSSYHNFYVSLLNGKQSNLWFYEKEDKKVKDIDLRDIFANNHKLI